MGRELKRIEICGGIASGKTTLARLLRRAGLIPIHENFRKNPFYLAFYRDPIGTAFEKKITFLLQHYHEEKKIISHHGIFCLDFSLVLDHAYACVTLSTRDLRLFRTILERAEAHLPRRSLLVHLTCPPQVELQRIRARRRDAERAITIEYLKNLNNALQARIKKLPRSENVLVVDSGNMDFAHRQEAKTDVMRQIKEALGAK